MFHSHSDVPIGANKYAPLFNSRRCSTPAVLYVRKNSSSNLLSKLESVNDQELNRRKNTRGRQTSQKPETVVSEKDVKRRKSSCKSNISTKLETISEQEDLNSVNISVGDSCQSFGQISRINSEYKIALAEAAVGQKEVLTPNEYMEKLEVCCFLVLSLFSRWNIPKKIQINLSVRKLSRIIIKRLQLWTSAGRTRSTPEQLCFL